MPFDRKIEPLAMSVVRAKIMLDEAQELYEAACEKFQAVVPEGAAYVTKDGETISHAKSSVVFQPVVDTMREYLTGKRLRFWKSIRVDAIDTKKLAAHIELGELDKQEMVENGCYKEIFRKASVRVNFPSTKSLVA